MNEKIEGFLSKKSNALLLVVIFSVLIILMGYFFYLDEEKTLRQNINKQLKSVTDLKAKQVSDWFVDEMHDAEVIAQNVFITSLIEKYISDKSFESRRSVEKFIKSLEIEHGYGHILVFSKNIELLASTNKNISLADDNLREHVVKAIQGKNTISTDLYYCNTHKIIHIDFIAPVLNKDKNSIGAIVFNLNPHDYLYPTIETWPIDKKHYQTLLIKKDKKNVVICNPLPDSVNSKLDHKTPLTKNHLPQVKTVLGYEGFIDGEDYRGIPIIAYSKKVTSSNWFLISRIDKSVLNNSLIKKGANISVYVIMIIIMLTTALAFIYSFRQRNIYRKLFTQERALRQYQEEFKTILYSIGDGVITTDKSGNVRQLNHTAADLIGIKEKEAEGKPLTDVFRIINEYTRETVESPVHKVLKEGVVVGLANHTLLLSFDGKEIPIADSGAPIRDENGNISGVVLVFRDQTEERNYQRNLQLNKDHLEEEVIKRTDELKRQYNYLRNLIDTIPNPIFLKNAKFEYVDVNKAFEKFFHIKREEIIGRRAESLYVKNLSILTKQYEERLLKDPALFSYETLYIGEEKNTPVLINIVSFGDEKVNVEGITGLIIDISLQKELETKLRSAYEKEKNINEMKTNFIATVSHEFRTPLTTILGSVELLERYAEPLADEKISRHIKKIHDSIEYMTGLTDDVLSISRSDRGKIKLEKTNVEINNLIEKLVEDCKAYCKNDQKINLVTSLDHDVINVDPKLITQILNNLIVNSIKYSNPNSEINVTVKFDKLDDQLLLNVKDNGSGIAKEEIEHIFEPFFRAKNSKNISGSGLGLSIVKRSVELHNGKIEVKSEPSVGTEFNVIIPTNN
ncbi:MAG: PAS domain S-box protein [Melioribacteraceae bacterium]|nr:PAS domain S-box protein [Melioribacteraceae bacterium]